MKALVKVVFRLTDPAQIYSAGVSPNAVQMSCFGALGSGWPVECSTDNPMQRFAMPLVVAIHGDNGISVHTRARRKNLRRPLARSCHASNGKRGKAGLQPAIAFVILEYAVAHRTPRKDLVPTGVIDAEATVAKAHIADLLPARVNVILFRASMAGPNKPEDADLRLFVFHRIAAGPLIRPPGSLLTGWFTQHDFMPSRVFLDCKEQV
jgi:hypothetical protein